MSKPSNPTVKAMDPARLAELRGRAASQLTGAAATKGATARTVDALTVLHALASAPETAADALTLLHELQVHQVELDLQAQELQESRAELESALRRQIELYDFQPVASLTVDARGVVIEVNRTGAEMLGVEHEAAFGLPLGPLFGTEGESRFKSTLEGVGAGRPRSSCFLRLKAPGGAERAVLASFGPDAAGGRYLVSLADVSDERGLFD